MPAFITNDKSMKPYICHLAKSYKENLLKYENTLTAHITFIFIQNCIIKVLTKTWIRSSNS